MGEGLMGLGWERSCGDGTSLELRVMGNNGREYDGMTCTEKTGWNLMSRSLGWSCIRTIYKLTLRSQQASHTGLRLIMHITTCFLLKFPWFFTFPVCCASFLSHSVSLSWLTRGQWGSFSAFPSVFVPCRYGSSVYVQEDSGSSTLR